MAGLPPASTPTSIETVFELLDKKLVSLGVPTALSAVGINNIRTDKWNEAAWCFAGAAAVWMAIKVGKKLAPEIDQGLDHGIAAVKQLPQTLRTDFTSLYLRRQARQCEESTIEGFNPERTAIPLLEKVFVPLDLSGAMGALAPTHNRHLDPSLWSENLDIWKLLARSRQDRQFRQMCILAKGGMGKTTLLRHITLIYGQGKHRRHRAPKLVPVLLRLREWVDELTQPQPPGLAQLITEHYIPTLWRNHPPQVPNRWAENLLNRGQALVMLDGFDEIPAAKRPQVSRWITTQMEDYDQSVFLLTSRPKGYENYTAKRPTIPIYINPFNVDQQARFIQRWYLCQERCYRAPRHARQVAQEHAENLITQIQTRPQDLGEMAKNPLLLNLLVTLHRYAPSKALPSQRLGLYQRICSLQLDTRPEARLIQMLLPYEKSMALLQAVALHMVTNPSPATPNEERLVIEHDALLALLRPHPLLQKAQVDPADWLKQMVDVSELLVEREPKEYEFPHASFQGFFAARELAKAEDEATLQQHQQLVLQNWNAALWRETVLLYTAQLDPQDLNDIIPKASAFGSEAAQLADLCVKEYPRPEKVDDFLKALLENLETVTQDSKYQTLEEMLKAGQWRDADQETYRLMITTVGKEEGQWFERKDLEEFPCEDLRTLDQLWVKYSNGKFGFSTQKKIWQECGSPMTSGKEWDDFCVRVGWQDPTASRYMSSDEMIYNLVNSPRGELPAFSVPGVLGRWEGGGLRLLFSRAETCEL
ncbi:MAG: NACHT domain-containing protein [Leptolyngbya sp. DLM2.Bin27]|nr:MAG: NACHT domain-containing protein [Leptolyngbya sp. DLM2.Bin27]